MGGDVFGFIASLNANNHAGYTDWRAPNVKELQGIVNYENVNPAVSVEFNDACVSGCVVTDCSCTSTYPPTGEAVYWSSTYIVDNNSSAWCVASYVTSLMASGIKYVRFEVACD